MTVSSFSELALRPSCNRRSPIRLHHSHPHPIAGDPLSARRARLLGIAQTGTGKTAAFVLPILQKLFEAGVKARPGEIRALILTPTRELAIQIDESVKNYGAHLKPKHAVIFGGVGQRPQVDALQRGLDILVATPGRLLDLMNQRHVRFDGLSVFVLDEAVSDARLGFINDVRKIVADRPEEPADVAVLGDHPREIADMAGSLLKNRYGSK